LHALKPGADAKIEAVSWRRLLDMDKSGRLRALVNGPGDHEDVSMTSGMLDNLRSVYLKPLRDAEQGLKPSRTSQLSRLVHLLSDEADRVESQRLLKS